MKARKKRETMTIILVVCIVIVAAVAGMFGRKVYAKHKEAQRQEKVDAKLDEIQNLGDAFDKASDRNAKLQALKDTEESYAEYQKHEGIINDCIKLYESTLETERKYFEDDYNNTIKTNSVEDINAETDKDKLSTLVTTLTDLKKTIQIEYDIYSVVTEDKYNELNTTIDGLITSYTERAAAIDSDTTTKQQEEEAQQAQEAENQKKQETTTKKTEITNNNSNSNSNSSSSQTTTTTKKKKNTSSSSSSSSNNSNSSSSSSSSRPSNSSSNSSNSGNSSNSSNSNSDSSSGNSSSSNSNAGNSSSSSSNNSSSGNQSNSNSGGLGNEEGGYWYIDEETGELYN